jgi:hypothetical protein
VIEGRHLADETLPAFDRPLISKYLRLQLKDQKYEYDFDRLDIAASTQKAMDQFRWELNA